MGTYIRATEQYSILYGITQSYLPFDTC